MYSVDDELLAPSKPGWLKKDGFLDEHSLLFDFFVINTPIETLSAKAKPLTDYGWPKDVWRKTGLRQKLLDSTTNPRGFISVSRCSDLKRMFAANNLSKGFHKNRKQERVVIHNTSNFFQSLFIHIRNALAHGRYQIYDDFLVFEGAKKKRGQADRVIVRARGVIKIHTLEKWIEIIEAGPDQMV